MFVAGEVGKLAPYGVQQVGGDKRRLIGFLRMHALFLAKKRGEFAGDARGWENRTGR